MYKLWHPQFDQMYAPGDLMRLIVAGKIRRVPKQDRLIMRTQLISDIKMD